MARFPLLTFTLILLSTWAGAEVISNPGTAPQRSELKLREMWRVGGEDESDILMGKVGVVISGPDGLVYALDSQLSEVQVFDRSGQHQGTLGREGEGPGEFREPINMFLPGDGSIAVQQAYPGRITYLDPVSGNHIDTWSMGKDDPESGGFAFIETSRRRGGTFLISAANTAFDLEAREIRGTNFLAVLDAEGHESLRLAEVSSVRSLVKFTIDELAQYFPGERGLWDIAPDGRIYLATSYNDYVIAIHDTDGTLLGTFSRDHEARVRTEAEKEDQRTSMNININGMEPEIDWKLQDRNRCVQHLQILDDGTIWIRNSHADDEWEDLGRRVFDVFDADGHLLRETIVTIPEGGEGHRLIPLDDGRFILIKGMDSLSVSISAGDGDEGEFSDEELSDILLEIICYEQVR